MTYKSVLGAAVLACACLGTLAAPARAFTSSSTLEETASGHRLSLDVVYDAFRRVRDGATAPRHSFEQLAIYEARVAAAERNLDAFSRRTFRCADSFDTVAVDWQNSTLTLAERSFVPVLRRANGGDPRPRLELVVPIPPALAREIVRSPNGVHFTCQLHVSPTGALVLDRLEVFYRQTLLYKE